MASPCNHINDIITLQKMIHHLGVHRSSSQLCSHLTFRHSYYQTGLDVVGLHVGLHLVGLDKIVGLHVKSLDVGFHVVGVLVMGDFSPPPQTQHAMFAVSLA
jgi:hypothetical protein